jgi:hypothetical protein
MSPVVKKWGMRFTVLLCSSAFSVSSLVLVTSVFGAEGSVANIIDPESWFQWIERYGIPLVALVAIGFGFYRGISAVWQFLKPHLNRVFEAFTSLIEKQSVVLDNMDRRQERIEVILSSDQAGHKHTHKLLGKLTDEHDDTQKMVKDVHDKFGRT